MSQTFKTQQPSEDSPLAMRPRDAAKSLGIGERTLWQLTKDNKIPHAKVGRIVMYPVAELKKWLAEQSSQGIKTDK